MIRFNAFCRSIFFFIISIMAFVWRTGTIEDASQTPMISHDALAPRIIVTCVFSLGLVYLIFIRITFQRYGSAMDRAWRTRVLVWMHQNFDNIPIDSSHSLQNSFPSISKHSSKHAPLRTSQNASPPTPVLAVSEAFMPAERPRGRSTSIKPISTFVKADNNSPASRKSVIKLTKIVGLSADDPSADVTPSNEMLISYQMTKDDWERLFSVRTIPRLFVLVMKYISSYRSYRKFVLLGSPIICRLYKILSSAGIKPFSVNVGLRSYYVKNLEYPGSSMRYITSLGRINCRLSKIHMIPFPNI